MAKTNKVLEEKIKKPDKLVEICGYIMKGVYGDASDILFLIDPRPILSEFGSGVRSKEIIPLAKAVSKIIGHSKRSVSINYHITDEPFSNNQLQEMLISKICGINLEGVLESQFSHRYSELTGYLWTNEDFKVGGHDMIQRLSGDLGKWCHLNLNIHY